MFNVGGGELLVILLVALIVLGPQRLPGAARQVGKVMGDLRRVSSGFQQELRDAFDAEADDAPPRRAEPVPLAGAVADAEADAEADDPSAPAGHGTPALREVPAGDSPAAPPPVDATGVAPAVAEALDEIVPPAADGADHGPGTSTDVPGDGGDERAAS